MTKMIYPNSIEYSVSIDEELHEELSIHAEENDLHVQEIVHNEIARFFRAEELKNAARSN